MKKSKSIKKKMSPPEDMMKSIGDAVRDKCDVLVVAAIHKSDPKPIVFFRGHIYDAARLSAFATRHLKGAIDKSIGESS